MTRAPYFIRAIIDAHTLPRPEISDHTAEELAKLGLIERRGVEDQWTTTARGNAYVQLLSEVPLPEQKWVDPRQVTR